ncbi:MAG: glycosyltransferase family 2 protein [Ignavibacteria bacterium]|nr:glycosyltransferase family 2 protein [Ignavibacteria bacterium]
MKISVIMASWFNPNRQNMDKKLIRAIKSFINQSYKGEKELIIVSDGCLKTKEIYETHFKDNKEIIYFHSQKQPMYSGGIRSIGLKIATGDIICYLDNDDVFGKEHLQTIVDQFTDDVDWVYYNDFMVLNKEFTKFYTRWVDPRWASIGTSSIAHKNPKKCEKLKDIEWFTGYGHDFLYVLKLASLGTKFKKLQKNPQYIVCHYRDGDF